MELGGSVGAMANTGTGKSFGVAENARLRILAEQMLAKVDGTILFYL